MDEKQKDIQDVMRQEGRRGRRPEDPEGQREHRENLSVAHRLLEIPTEEEFVEAMLEFGLREGSEELIAAIETWHEPRC